MALVLIGPSCAGKSTMLRANGHHHYFESQYDRVIYGHELKRKAITTRTIIHYNMLRQSSRRYRRLFFRTEAQRWHTINAQWDFNAEPAYVKIFQSGLIERCIVLVAPITELIDRIQHRTLTETHNPTRYPRHYWMRATTHLHLHTIYEQLFTDLEQRGVPYTVYLSSKTVEGFAQTHRDHVQSHLRGCHRSMDDD